LATGASLLAPLRYRPYAFLLPALGAVLSSLVLHHAFRETGGHGVTEVIYSISRRGGLLRLRSAFSRLLSSMLTIASGGSAGPEAPVVISGSSIGSNISNIADGNDRQRTVMVGCGAAGAIAAIFNAPMAGIAFSMEAILGEWRPVQIVPIAIASVVATQVSRVLQGNQIPFEHRVFGAGTQDLAFSLGLALFCAAGAILLMRMLRLIERNASRWVAPLFLRAGAGGLLVGALGMTLPVVLGEGYESIRTAIAGNFAPGLGIVGACVLAKIAATSLTIGSGGSGGIFAPCIVVGSLVGVFYRRILMALSLAVPPAGEGYFALLGMAGLLSSVLQAPLTAIFLIIEITGSYEIILPVVLVAVVSAAVSQRFEPHSIYHQELVNRGELLRPRTDARVLADLTVREVASTDVITLRPDMPLSEVIEILRRSRRTAFPVVEPKDGQYLGMIRTEEIRGYLFDETLRNSVLVEEIMDPAKVGISPDEELSDIMEKFDELGVDSLPVVDGNVYVGLISKVELLEQYRLELIVQEDQ
ncbi:MAG: chloride channel protein, partial [Acidobacteriota bacterium]